MKKILDGIRTEITLNNGDSTRLDVTKQSVTLLSITVVKSEISNDKQKQSVDALISILYIEFGKGNQKLLYIRNRL